MPIEETLCPSCGARMKPAVSSYGAYWRCTRWGCEGRRDSMGRSKQEKEDEEDEEDRE